MKEKNKTPVLEPIRSFDKAQISPAPSVNHLLPVSLRLSSILETIRLSNLQRKIYCQVHWNFLREKLKTFEPVQAFSGCNSTPGLWGQQ